MVKPVISNFQGKEFRPTKIFFLFRLKKPVFYREAGNVNALCYHLIFNKQLLKITIVLFKSHAVDIASSIPPDP